MKKQELWVKAIPGTHVREIMDNGMPMMAVRYVGKQYNVQLQLWEVLDCGQIICYHTYYLKCLREKSLLPMNMYTALAAGIGWDMENETTMNKTENV
jgi:hypothetical protein